MTLYRDILKQAWQVTWRHKFLWWFGFLASFWSLGSAYEVIYKSFNLSEQQEVFGLSLWREIATTGVSWADVSTALQNAPLAGVLIVVGLLVAAAVILLFYWLFTCSQIALIKGIDAVETKRTDWHRLLEQSRSYFWPVFGTNLFSKVLTFGLLLILSYPVLQPLLGATFSLPNFMLFLLVFIVVFLAVLVIALLTVYTVIFITLRELSFGQAIRSAWRLFCDNWLISLEAAFILFVVSVLVAVVFLVASTLAFIPFLFAFQIAAYLQSVILFWLLVIVAGLVILTTFILASAILTTFQMAVWTTIFEQMATGKMESKLHRLASTHLGID
ncbi:hypothetical protein HY933_00340 [Candidatus Falkowbacteria bacterium]|nr:hypothetical protein [Candidatus Falkowbacteria bacterium]